MRDAADGLLKILLESVQTLISDLGGLDQAADVDPALVQADPTSAVVVSVVRVHPFRPALPGLTQDIH
jgi:hypothetical protein